MEIETKNLIENICLAALFVFIATSLFLINEGINVLDDGHKLIYDKLDDLDHSTEFIRGSLICENTTTVPFYRTGLYDSDSDKIDIYIKGRSFEKVYGTFIHEWGHHVWYNDLNQVQRDYWCNLKIDQNVTTYAAVTCTESFAETYKYWYLNKTIPEPQKTYFEEYIDDPI